MTTLAKPRPTISPTGMLVAVIIKRLVPMFLKSCSGNVDVARTIAAETVDAFCARNHADVFAIAQIIACGMASLDNVILSMAEEISHTLRLRLQSTANAMNRTIEHNRRFLKETPPERTNVWFEDEQAVFEAAVQAGRKQATAQHPPTAEPTTAASPGTEPAAAAMPAPPAPEPATMPRQPAMPQPPMPKPATPAAEMTDHEKALLWAGSMNRIAGEYAASIPNLPPAQRPAATMRANALSTTASALIARTMREQPKTP